MILRDVVKEYLKEQAGRLDRDNISVSEYKNKCAALNLLKKIRLQKNLLVEWDTAKLAAVVPGQVIKEVLLSSCMQERAVKTQKNYLVIFKQLFDYAVQSGHMVYNPLHKAKVEEVRRGEDLLAERLTERDINLLKLNMDQDFKLALEFALQTGVRQGEQRAVQWSDIDFEKRMLRINKGIARGIRGEGISPTKTRGSVRNVPLTEGLCRLLKEEFLQQGRPDANCFVFCSRNNSFLQARVFHIKLSAAIKRAGIKEIRWHDLRHYFASKLFDSLGEEYFVVSSLLGHSSVDFTRKQYVHWMANEKRDDKIRAALGG